jgi:aldose 1-epimerase
VGLVLKYHSTDGEEGFPGTLDTTVTYRLSNEDFLQIDYLATTDSTTVVNLTNHSYFNLSAGKSKDALDHVLQLNADKYTPVDGTSIPIGENVSVKNTPMDFLEPHAIGERIEQTDGGYDHNWVLNSNGGLTKAATVHEPISGRVMEVHTTHPGVQFYAGNYLDGMTGKYGINYVRRYGFCLETQHFPDSPNNSNFPSTVLKKGDEYRHRTVFKFSAK